MHKRVLTLKQNSAVPHIIFLDCVNKECFCQAVKMLNLALKVPIWGVNGVCKMLFIHSLS